MSFLLPKLPKRAVLLFLSVLLLFQSSFVAFIPNAEAAAPSFKTQVNASVGEFYLNLYGYISPYATVVLYSNGVFLRSTVADSGGNFSITGVLIRAGFSSFCLVAIDFHRLGDSETCINIPPAVGDVTMRDIFLPPTLGLSRSEIAAGESVLAFGYTMPGALVKLKLSDGRTLETYADGDGYYVFKLSDLKAGKYTLIASAHYKGKDSLSPTRGIILHALSLWEQFTAWLVALWKKFITWLTSVGLGPLWLALPILILIIILIIKLWPDQFTTVYENTLVNVLPWLFKPKEKKLHHAWMEGVGF